MPRMPFAGAALIAAGLFFAVLGIAGWGMSVQPVSKHWGAPDPSQMSWGRDPAAMSLGLGISALWFGWVLMSAGERPERKSQKTRRRQN